ncbi:MAG: glycosyltransferase family 39 protein [Candidatus Alcyoniella australis]|nr:glycosyltransferase family 39 protein [Candidatus Alcyoniella australis]
MKIESRDIRTAAFYALLAGSAFALRMHDIGQQPMWTDEATTIEPIRRLGLLQFLSLQASIDPNPPLYHLLAYLWGRLGSSVEWIRAFSAVCGALSVPLVYRLGREALSRPASLLAALWLMITPLHVHLSQQARYPAFLGLCAVLSMLYLVRSMDGGTSVDRRRFILFSAAMLYTHAFSVLVIAVELLVTIIYCKKVKGLGRLALSWLMVGLLFAPWIGHVMQQAKAYHGVVSLLPLPLVLTMTPVYLTMGYTDWHPPLRLPLSVSELFGLDKLDITLHLTILTLALLPFLALWGVGALRGRKREIGHGLIRLGLPLGLLMLIGAIVAVTLGLEHGWLNKPISLFKPYYLVVLLPMACLLFASGAEAAWRRSRLAAMLLVCVAAIPTWSGLREYQHPLILKEDWPGAAELIEQRARTGDGVLLPNRLNELCFDNYFDLHIPMRTVTGFHPMPDGSEPVAIDAQAVDAAFEQYISGLERVWIISAYPERTDPQRLLRQRIDQELYPIGCDNFRGNDPQLEPRFKLELYTTRPEVLWREFTPCIDFMQDDFHFLQLDDGWSSGGEQWRWIGPRAKAWLQWTKGADRLSAQIFVDTGHFEQVPFFVHLTAEGRVVNSLYVTSTGIFDIQGVLPSDLKWRPILEVELISEQFFISNHVYGDGDMEPKSINVQRIELQ